MATHTIDPVYTTDVTVTGGRRGRAVCGDGSLELQLRPPGVSGEVDATNPEQLFAAGYGACFQSALMSAAREQGQDATDSTVNAEVSLGKDETGFFGLAVVLTVTIPGMEAEQVQALADAAHERCPYSRATRGNIEVRIAVGKEAGTGRAP